MRFTQVGMSEHALASHFEYLCALNGAQRPAYVPVVASGFVTVCSLHMAVCLTLVHSANALIIHYTSNNQVVRDGEMILIDAGCEYK